MPSSLVRWAAGYVAGVALGDALGCPAALARGLGLLGLLLMAIGFFRRRHWPRWLPIWAVLLGLWAQAQRPLPVDGSVLATFVRSNAASDGHSDRSGVARSEIWLLQGVVSDDIHHTAQGLRLRLAVHALRPLARAAEPNGQPTPAPTWLHATPALPTDVYIDGQPPEALWPGDALRVAASLRLPPTWQSDAAGLPLAANGSAPLISAYAAADGVLRLAAAIPVSAWVGLDTKSAAARGPKLLALRYAAQARVALLHAGKTAWSRLPSWLTGSAADSAATAAMVTAMTLGERGPLRQVDAQRRWQGLPTVEDRLRQAGIYHVLSVSGLHLSVVGLTFLALVTWLGRLGVGLGVSITCFAQGLPGRQAATLTLPVVAAYALLTGAEPPTVRAAVSLGLILLARASGRRARLSSGLALALLWSGLPLGADSGPQQLFSPSLVLSFAATLGIAYLRPLASLLPSSHPLLQPSSAVAAPTQPALVASLAWRLGRLLFRLLDASLAALLMTLPLLAYYFAEVQGAALLGNLLVTPIAEFIVLPCGLISSLLALLWPPLALPATALAAAAGHLTLYLATPIAELGLTTTVAAPARALLVLWYGGLAWGRYRPRLGWPLLVAALLIHLVLWLRPADALRLAFLDVGQGDAAVAELPGDAVVVIDAGWQGQPPRAVGPNARASSPSGMAQGAGAKTPVTQYLHRRGHRRIDLLIVSHRHPDHMGGVATLLRQFSVDVLWLSQPPDHPPRDRDSDALAAAEADLVRLARQRGTLVAVPHSLRLSGVAIDVLSPCPMGQPCRAKARADWQENDNSLVVALRYAGRTILLTGDIESAAEQTLVRSGAPLRADILKLPHHGSRTSTSDALLAAVAPGLAVASLGRQNRFGFPHAPVVDRLAARQIPLLRTDQDGTITVEIHRDGGLHVQRQSTTPPLWLAR